MTTTEEAEALAVYGTLAPGETNHYVVRSIPGEWTSGVVSGYRFEVSWGPAEGYPGIVLDPDGPEVPVMVLTSPALAKHWRAIDDFEGPGYARVKVEVRLEDGTVADAWIYEALTDNPD